MTIRLICLALLLIPTSLLAQRERLLTPYERSNQTATATHDEAIAFYRELAARYPRMVKLHSVGKTDVGRDLHLVVINGLGILNPDMARNQGTPVVLIINSIHPGEPEGADASMALVRDLFADNTKHSDILRNVQLCIIPMYNVDGTLDRGRPSRANQNGPDQLGFRGNARNLDLNRDFIKTDSRNAQAFNRIMRDWRPHIQIDNHTSNGADYQHVMTLLNTQVETISPVLRPWYEQTFIPALYKQMQSAGFPMVPYVNTLKDTPEQGIAQLDDSPRYSSGYASLFNCLAIVAETHMLKPFPDRVKATYALNLAVLQQVAADQKGIIMRQLEADRAAAQQQTFTVNWTLDTTRKTQIPFMGYQATYEPSAVHGEPRLKYDRSKPWTGTVPFYPYFTATATATRPWAYVIPQAWHEVVERLRNNGVRLRQLPRDTVLAVEAAYIREYQTTPRPYEGHYLHYNVKTEWTPQRLTYRAGDYVVEATGPTARYLVETLDPLGPDSFFAWGFFDSVLQQKEGYSDYVWEDRAAALLATDADLKRRFEAWRAEGGAKSARAQLDWIYQNSAYYEPTHNRYPVARILQPVKLQLNDAR